MTDHDFELRLQRVLRADAERAVRPIDPVALAEAAVTTTPATRRLDWRPVGWPMIRLVLIASLLLVAALATLWLVTGAPRRQGIIDVVPSPTTGPATAVTLRSLSGPWIADRPPTLSLGTSSVASRMSLFFDGAGVRVFVSPADDSTELLASNAHAEGQDIVRLTSPTTTAPVENGGTNLRACATGETGTYRVQRSGGGLRLTLGLIADACPSRAFVYARTWTRWLGLPNSGGIGIVDAFDPMLSVELPPGGYTTERTTDALTIIQTVPEFQFLAWKDPQGWNDPCDQAKGRYQVEPGADAFVAYFRQLQGFTVDSTSELQVDGHRAVRVRLHANPDVACPQPYMYQTKAETGLHSWFLRPGDNDSYILVDLADDTTLMFEVLPAPNALEDQVIGSIQFLDQLPEAP